MKPFNASEFISNQETPVVSRHGRPIELLTVKGRGNQPVVGYTEISDTPQCWFPTGMFQFSNIEDQWDLFFAPKVEVVHVFLNTESGKAEATIRNDQSARWKTYATYTYLGTITGPIVPQTKSGVVK